MKDSKDTAACYYVNSKKDQIKKESEKRSWHAKGSKDPVVHYYFIAKKYLRKNKLPCACYYSKGLEKKEAAARRTLMLLHEFGKIIIIENVN